MSADPFGTVLEVLLIGRERGKGPIGKIPGESPDKSGKCPGKSQNDKKGQKRTKKEGQVQIGKPPRLKHPHLAALDLKSSQQKTPRSFSHFFPLFSLVFDPFLHFFDHFCTVLGLSVSDRFWPSVFALFRAIHVQHVLPFSGCPLDSPHNLLPRGRKLLPN